MNPNPNPKTMNQVGSCDLRRVPHEEVTRETLMTATEPLVITGLTNGWSAMANWKVGTEVVHAHMYSIGRYARASLWA